MKMGKRDYLRIEDTQLQMSAALNKIDTASKTLSQIMSMGKKLKKMNNPEKLNLVKTRLKNVRAEIEFAMKDFYEAIHKKEKAEPKDKELDLFYLGERVK